MADDYQFGDVDSTSSPAPASDPTPAPASDDGELPASPAPASSGGDDFGGGNAGGSGYSGGSGGSGGGSYATELFSKQIKAKFRTFFIDLKESSNGKFVKVSEKSHGRKSTIMMDAEDVPAFIEALQEVQTHL